MIYVDHRPSVAAECDVSVIFLHCGQRHLTTVLDKCARLGAM